jgi:hypothetical protein
MLPLALARNRAGTKNKRAALSGGSFVSLFG